MAFFRQLKLLLWKNGLGVVRQPAWSLTLIIWPLIIFIIIAVTRNQFPPVLRETCYVAPRNLPSTGFFPFLQTLMCNTDTYCHNSSQVHPTSSKHAKRTARSPILPKNNPLAKLLQGETLPKMDIPLGSMDDAAALIEFINNIFGSSYQQKMNNASLLNVINASLPQDQSLEELMASMTLLKKTICQSVLPMMNMSSPTHLTFAVVTFCNSNNTVFEVMLVTLNQILVDLMLTKPDEMVNFVGATLFIFDHLQSQSSLWEAFLALPELFSSTSVDQIAGTTEALLTNIQGVLHIIRTNFPNVSASVQAAHPVLAGGISVTRYIQNWPGKNVSVSLGDVLVLYNDSLSEMVKPVLQAVKIPLDKAIALTLDRDVVRGFVCNNSDNPMWLTAACMSGSVDMFLGWISPENLAKQVLLKWSKHVAQHDLLFAKGLLEALMGVSSPGGQGGSNVTRTRRSIGTQPQNIEEDLFLSVGEVVLDILKISPEASTIVQAILRAGLESMETATLALKTVNKMVDHVLKDANQLQMSYLTLMTNQTQTKIWINRFIENVLDLLMEGLAFESMTCEDVLGRFEWLLDTESVRIEGWRSVICQNDSILQQVLLSDWQPLIDKVQELIYTMQGLGGNDVTLPMILSEWHLLFNQTEQFGGLLGRVAEEMGPKYWMNWMTEHDTSGFMETLQQSVLHVMVRLGQEIEQSQLWPLFKDYFHMTYWILNYKPGITTQPANCSVDINDLSIHCDTGLNWQLFVHTLSQTLMSPSQDVLLNCLKGTVNLLQHVYGDVYKYLAASYLKNEIRGGDALSDFLINLMNNLNDFTQNLTMLPDQSISNPRVMFPLYSHLLQSTGLGPLLPLILSDGPLNITQVFEVASKLGRLNQHIFTFNETDPTMPELERLIMQFLSSEGNLTMSLALSMGNTLLTYSQYISPEYVARLREAIQPFTSQTSAGIVEAILSAIELVKTVIGSPDGNPTTVILGYIRQLQECIMSLLRLRRTEQLMLPNGQLITTQVADLYQPTAEILNLLTPEGLQSLAQAGPDAAQDIIAKKLIAFLPPAVHQQASAFLRDFIALQHHVTQCATGQNCLAGISEIFSFLDQILDMMVSAKGNVTIETASSNSFLGRREYEEVASMVFSLLLAPNDAAVVTTFKQTLLFIRLVMANPNITVSHVQNALKQSNLTIEELNHIASLAGAGNMNDFLVNILSLISSYQCFELHPASVGTTQCVVGLINGISSFLMHVPALQKQTAILSIIPLIVNKTLSNIAHADFSSNPDRVVFQTLNSTLANVQMALHMNNLITPEIMKEFKVLENILKVAADPTPLKYIFNLTMDPNPFLAQKAVQEMIMWYLKRLENVTSSSSISDLLYPFFHLSQMQVALQLAQADVSSFVSDRIDHLMRSLQYPLDAEGLRKIGLTSVEILQRLFKLVMINLDAQNNLAIVQGLVPPFNATLLDATKIQVNLYLNIIQQWMTQPNALQHLNLTTEELNDIAAQAGFSSISDLLVNMMTLINSHQCFEQEPSPAGTARCVMGLIMRINGFLSHVPALKDEKAILSIIPYIFNKTISNIMHANLTSNPQMAVLETLNTTLASIKMTLQLNNLSSPEIMNELRMIETLLKVGADPTTLGNFLNASMHPDPLHAQKAFLETLSKSLKRLENATSGSSIAEVLHSILRAAQMQVELQLAQINFSIFISNQIDYLTHNLQFPLNAQGVSKIGETAIEILRRVLRLIRLNLDAQNDNVKIYGFEMPLNATLFAAAEFQINLYLNIVQHWMAQPNVFVVLTSMLQWGNSSMSYATPVNDFYHLLQTVLPFLDEDQRIFLSFIGNITQSLSKALTVAQQPNGLQSDHFLAAISEAIQTIMLILMPTTGPVPVSLQQNILGIVQYSVKLIVHPDVSYASGRNLSLLILKNAEGFIQQIFPPVVAQYMLGAVKVITTYFETISTAAGPDNFNELILNEMMTIHSLLPPHSISRTYISALINITHFILASGQDNMGLFGSFVNASPQNLPQIIEQMGKLLNMIWRLIMGSQDSLTQPKSLGAFSQLPEVLEQLIGETATQETWHNLMMMLKALLSIIEKTEHWESVPSVVSLLEKAIGTLVKTTKAETGLIVSLQMPVMTLMTEIAQSVNSSRFNLSEFTERLQHAIERTLVASQQANGTLECSSVLKIWEGVREAAGLSHNVMAVWCNTNLQPVIEAHAETDKIFAHLNMTHTGTGPVTVNATAARIVKTVQSLYYVSFNQSRVLEQFVMTFSRQLDEIAGKPLSPEAQFHWYKQLQNIQLENSLSSIRMLSEELLSEFPFLQPYIEAVEKALAHILNNYDFMTNSISSQKVLSEAGMIFLSSANITPDDVFMMWGNFSDLNGESIADMMIKTVQMMVDMEIFGGPPMVYETLEQLLAYNDTRKMVQKVAELFLWLTSTQPSRPDFLNEALPELAKCILSFLRQMIDDLPINLGLFEDLPQNIIEILRKLLSASGVLPPMNNNVNMYRQQMQNGNNTVKTRRKRELPAVSMRSPVDDFIDLIFIDYSTMFSSLSVLPTQVEMIDTAHVFFANPDLAVVVKGATRGIQWDMKPSREETIDAVLGMASILTLPEVLKMSSVELVMNAVDMLPDDFPFSSLLKNITKVLASESQENLSLMQKTIHTATTLFQTGLTDPRFTKQLSHLRAQVCALENTNTMRLLMHNLGIKPGEICHVLLPGVQNLVESLVNHTTSLFDIIYQTFVGDLSSYHVQNNWGSVFTQGLGFNISSLSTFSINITMPGAVTIGEMLRNKTAFILDVQQYMDLDQAALNLLIETPLPNNNLQILSWLVNLRHCNSPESVNMKPSEEAIYRTLCSMSPQQLYSLTVLMTRHINLEKFIYRMVLPEEMQNLVGVMLQIAKIIINMMNKILPAIDQLQNYIHSIHDLNLGSNNEFMQMSRGQRKSISGKATFVTISRALCSNGILALLGISKIPKVTESYPSFTGSKREEMIERFKIPRNATPFCTNMYLDMVNTTGGAIAWAFLKPMLMGHILYTPDTPLTRDIMKKSNLTLHEFGNLRKHSQDWIESSNYLIKSSELLSHTLPMLQNSLGNSFVKNFIEMQTDINVGRMKETLGNFSNMTAMLEKNKDLLNQITTLSTLMVDLSSCIKFDRFRGYDSAEQLDTDAQELAKNRDLYASVIFKLPKDEKSPKSSPSTSALPPKVSYTIRMHMDNVMRTDRVRDPYFVKDPHVSATMTMRYNRGFIYLQETIDRAIIETQAGRRITEPAVQMQPFPYPCHLRDEYLEAISFVFPLMLMIAWVLFVADFVKKLVHERELRLHEYMKMMGVNPVSHFFAWFLECASYLGVTIIILTFLLKYGHILPHSDGFLIFLYLCDYGLSILAFSYLISSFFDKTYIAGLSGSLLYILSFFPFIVVMAVESKLTFCQKSLLSLFSPTCFSYASQYLNRYEAQAEGIQWSNSYLSPIAGDSASFGWLCWLMLIDSILYFILGVYIRMVFPGKYGIAAPWYFPFTASFWAKLCCRRSQSKAGRGLFFTNIMQSKQTVLSDDKGKGHSALSSQAGEDCSELPVGVSLHGLSKIYGERVAIDNLNVTFYEGHVTSLLGHNGAGKTTTMSLLTGLFAPSSGTIEVYGKDMQTNINDVRKELGVCMQYDVLFDHMTAKEHLLLYGQIKAPHWSQRELREQVRTILEETGMYAHRHKRVGTLSGGMKRKLSISIAFIGGSRLVVLDEPTTGVDPCSRRNIWDIVIQHKKQRTIIMSTHHLDEAEVLSDRIAFLEKGGLKCCGSPFYLKDKLGQGYKLTITKKTQNLDPEQVDDVELKSFIQAHVPEARLKEAQGNDLVYLLPPFSSSNSSSYRSLLTALDANLDALQLGCYGISDTTLEEVFLHMTHGSTESAAGDGPLTVSETVSDSGSIDSFPTDSTRSIGGDSDTFNLTGSSMVEGVALVWQQIMAILIKRFHHSRRDWKGLISQILLPVLFVVFAMGLGSIKNDLQHFPELKLSPALYNIGPSYSFFSNQNPNSSRLVDAMLSFPGIDNACLDKSNDQVCSRTVKDWESRGNSSKMLGTCKCLPDKQVCDAGNYQPPHKKIPSSQTVYNLSGINLENYLVVTGNDFIRNRYGGFAFGKPLPLDLQLDLRAVPKNRTLSKVWFNPEGHHTMPAYLNSLNNIILRANLPADKDPREYAISVSSHPYFGRRDDEDSIVQGMLQILVAMCVLTGYSITTASFAIYEVNEHHTGSKRLQHIAGISEPLYWAVNFFYDMALYMIPVTVTVGVIAAFQISAFTDRQNLGAVALLLVLFGFATFPWMYILSSVFKDAEMAFITYVCINLFISVNTIASTSILYFLSQISVIRPEAILNIFNKLSYAFIIFPQFNFGNGLMMLARKDIEVQILSGYGVDAYKSPFCIDTLGWMFIASFVEGVLFFTLRLLLNKFILRKIRRLVFRRKAVPQAACEDEDEDVAAEHLRVASGAAGSDILQVNQLTKVYQHFKKKVHAVKRLSVGIPAGECFGLLGVNGAGKTTTFKMLTGDVSPTDGTAQIRDRDGRLMDIMECRNQGINIGYCPQVDALDDLLTGEEHLYFYARVHGISKREIRGVVNYLLKRLELTYHRNIVTDGYSCGTRRKLSTALALVGHPQILLLDEPSSGMDPRTKRHLWKIISEEVKGKCAVVLTSHSMEECEALCSRLAIMVKGQFRCLGSLQHIKNRFGSGFTVKMYLAAASCDAEAITGFMQRRFPSTYLKDQHSTMVEYHVPVAPGGVADIFDQLESNKNALQIKHFSVSQTTLDEVFINFAMGKIGMEAIPIDSEEEFDDLGSVKEVET